jgi:dihydroorotate dehydrogenase electron transfer subunit
MVLDATMALFQAAVLEKRCLGNAYHHLVLGGGGALGPWRPGQFVMLRAWPGWDPLLPRAFSLYGAGPGERVEILLRKIGAGTERLALLETGDSVTVHGPLGRPFAAEPDAAVHLLVAGGIGIAPLLPLAHALRGKRVVLLFGGRTKADHPGAGDFAGYAEVRLATDDGSAGVRGLVTDLLVEALEEEPRPAVYACGPEPMLARVAAVCREAQVPGQLSLEAPMACGYGACMGCVVRTRDGYRRVCLDGPIFRAEEVYR